MSAVNETVIREIVSEVLGRLGGVSAPKNSAPAPAPKADCGCNGKSHAAAPGLRGKFGVFTDANEACAAAHESFLQLQKAGVAARSKCRRRHRVGGERRRYTAGNRGDKADPCDGDGQCLTEALHPVS